MSFNYKKIIYQHGMTLLEVLLAVTLGSLLLGSLLICWQNIRAREQQAKFTILRTEQVRTLNNIFYFAAHTVSNISCSKNKPPSAGSNIAAQVIAIDQLPSDWRQEMHPHSNVLLLSSCETYRGVNQNILTAFYIANSASYKANTADKDIVSATALYEKVLMINHQPQMLQRMLLQDNVEKIDFKLFCIKAAGTKKNYYNLTDCSSAGIKQTQLQHSFLQLDSLLAYPLPLAARQISSRPQYWWQGQWHQTQLNPQAWPSGYSYIPLWFNFQ